MGAEFISNINRMAKMTRPDMHEIGEIWDQTEDGDMAGIALVFLFLFGAVVGLFTGYLLWGFPWTA